MQMVSVFSAILKLRIGLRLVGGITLDVELRLTDSGTMFMMGKVKISTGIIGTKIWPITH